MARKRIISPEIWESEGFGSLTVLGKVLYIGMISLADDEGRGRANASLLKARILPYNEEVRIAEVEKALMEISTRTSTTLYEVDRTKYYAFDNWRKWQYIEKPRPSYLPAPPCCGEGGDIPSCVNLGEQSGNSRGIVGEQSPPNRKEKKRKESNNVVVGLSNDEYQELCDKIGKGDCDYYLERIKAFLQKYPDASLSVKATILKWRREDERKAKEEGKKSEYIARTYTDEELDSHITSSDINPEDI